MALVVKDRVQETTTTTGTGTVTLAGAVTGFQTFAAIGDGNTTYYAIISGTDWEVGLGTYTASGTTLSRDTILESSNAGSAITLSGTSNVFCTYPAERSVNTADIGTTIQAYDADTTKNDVANTFTANQVISVTDNSNAALRITQLGTGNALVVEDSTNPDSTPFVVDTDGKVLVGTTTSRTDWNNQTIGANIFQVERAGSQLATAISICANSGTSAPTSPVSSAARLLLGRTRGTTVGSTTVVADNDVLGEVSFQGSDGTQQVEAASITAYVDGTPGADDMPGRIVFSTTADGASTSTEQMRIDSSGNLKFNSGYGSVATAYAARAWVQFSNTAGTPSINESGNVSSITDEGVGRYTVNFATAMPDANYSTAITCGDDSTTQLMYGLGISTFTPSITTTSCRFYTSNATPTFQDKDDNSFVVFR
jgi:hypothetical protein